MKAIETRYKGHRFRSRTEARWAVLFGHLGVAYEYEPEGYELADGKRYLPDFYAPRENCYFEIKGGSVDKDELHRAGVLAFESQRFVNVLVGQPGDHRMLSIRPAKPVDPALIKWLEDCPDEWIKRHTARQLRDGHRAVPPELLRFTYPNGRVAPEQETRYRVDENVELDFNADTKRLVVWTGHALAERDYVQWQHYGVFAVNTVHERLHWYGQPMNWDYSSKPHYDFDRYHQFDAPAISPEFMAAVSAARSARFEFGESGAG